MKDYTLYIYIYHIYHISYIQYIHTALLSNVHTGLMLTGSSKREAQNIARWLQWPINVAMCLAQN